MMRQNFYGTDLERVKSLWGSRDHDFVKTVIESEREALTDIAGRWEDDSDEDNFVDLEKVLHEIVDGTAKTGPGEDGWIYCEMLDIICTHLGKNVLGADEYMIGDWDGTPIEDCIHAPLLGNSGPPIPVPYNPGQGADIGHIDLKDIPGEIQRIDAMPEEFERRQNGLIPRVFRKLFGGEKRKLTDSEEWQVALEYRGILVEAQEKNVSLIAYSC